jgi:hypothetical protein
VGNWDHGRQDLQRKKKAERARKLEAISFLFFWLGITQKERASERAVLTPPGIYKEFEVFVSSTHRKTTESLVFSRQSATMEELHSDERAQGRG